MSALADKVHIQEVPHSDMHFLFVYFVSQRIQWALVIVRLLVAAIYVGMAGF